MAYYCSNYKTLRKLVTERFAVLSRGLWLDSETIDDTSETMHPAQKEGTGHTDCQWK